MRIVYADTNADKSMHRLIADFAVHIPFLNILKTCVKSKMSTLLTLIIGCFIAKLSQLPQHLEM